MFLRRADHSSRGVLPTVLRCCLWYRNLKKNGEAIAGVGPHRHIKKILLKCEGGGDILTSLGPVSFSGRLLFREVRYLITVIRYRFVVWWAVRSRRKPSVWRCYRDLLLEGAATRFPENIKSHFVSGGRPNTVFPFILWKNYQLIAYHSLAGSEQLTGRFATHKCRRSSVWCFLLCHQH